MINQQLLEYVRTEVKKGTPSQTIKELLLKNGWSAEDFNLALMQVAPVQNLVPVAPLAPTVPFSGSSTYPLSQGFQPTPVVMKPHSGVGKKIFFALLLILLLIGGGGTAYAYYFGYFITPEQVTSKGIESIRTSTGSTFDGTISADITYPTSAQARAYQSDYEYKKISFSTKGSYDITDASSTKAVDTVTFSADGSKPINGAVEVRVVDHKWYFNITKAPVVSFFPTLAQYENKWFYISLGDTSGEGSAGYNPLAGFDPTTMITSFKGNLTQQQKDELVTLAKNAHYITITKRLAPETVGGALSYHFVIDLDRVGIDVYFDSLQNFLDTNFPSDATPIPGMNSKSGTSMNTYVVKMYRDYVKLITDFGGEIWIGQKDNLLHKLNVDFAVTPESFEAPKVKIHSSIVLSDWNQPTYVSAPANSVDIETFMGIPDGQARGTDAAAKAQLANARAQAELYYDENNSSYLNVCTKSTGISSMKTALQNLYSSADVACNDKATAWAMSAKLKLTADYWCADSTGMTKAMTKPLGKATICS